MMLLSSRLRVPPPPPSSGGLPSWVPAAGNVVAVPGNTMAAISYGTSAGGGTGGDSVYFNNWTSGVYAPEYGSLGSFVVGSGGDGDYAGNDLRRWDLALATWSRLNERSQNVAALVGGWDPNLNSRGWYPAFNGIPTQPGFPHNYDEVGVVSSAMGGGSKGSFVFLNRDFVHAQAGYRHPDLFDFNAAAWRVGSTALNINGLNMAYQSTWIFDSARNRHWGAEMGSGEVAISSVAYYTWSGGLATATLAGAGSFTMPEHASSIDWPVQDAWVVVGTRGGGATFSMAVAVLSTIGTGSIAFQNVTLTGDTIPPNNGYGLAHCPALNCFFVRHPSGLPQIIYKITPTSLTTAVVSTITMSGDIVALGDGVNGMWKRFFYAAPVQCLMWVDKVTSQFYAYKPVGL